MSCREPWKWCPTGSWDGRPLHAATFIAGAGSASSSAGQVARAKGIDLLIEAAGRLRAQGLTDFSLDIYGRVIDPDFQALINRHGLREQVVLRGCRDQEDLARCFEESDVYAFPTWDREPFGFAPWKPPPAGACR